MGFSVTFSELIFIVASVILASTVSAYMIYLGSLMQSNVAQIVSDARTSISLRIDIVYATIMNGTDTGFIIYAKNTGNLAIYDFSEIDVYVGEYGSAKYYRYSTTPSYGFFTLEDSDGDGVWEIGETAIITVYESDISGSVFEVRIKPLNGPVSIYLFSPP